MLPTKHTTSSFSFGIDCLLERKNNSRLKSLITIAHFTASTRKTIWGSIIGEVVEFQMLCSRPYWQMVFLSSTEEASCEADVETRIAGGRYISKIRRGRRKN